MRTHVTDPVWTVRCHPHRLLSFAKGLQCRVCRVKPVRKRSGSLRVQAMKVLLIDNYDSYAYNLYQLIAQVTGGKYAQLFS